MTDLSKKLQTLFQTLKVHNKDLEACFNDAVAVTHIKLEIQQLITQAKEDYPIMRYNTGKGMVIWIKYDPQEDEWRGFDIMDAAMSRLEGKAE